MQASVLPAPGGAGRSASRDDARRRSTSTSPTPAETSGRSRDRAYYAHPRADRHARARPRLARQRARPDGAARARTHARPRGAARRSRASSSSRSTRGAGSFVSRVDVGDLAGALRGAAHAREPSRRGSPPSARRDADRASARTRAPRRAARSPSATRRRRAGADRPRPAHPPPRLPLRAQPVPRGDARTSTTSLTLRIWFLALDRVARLDDAVTEHRELLEAIRDGDARPRRGRHAPPHRGLRAGDPTRCSERHVYPPPTHISANGDHRMSTLPRERPRRRHRLRHRRQQPRVPPHPARLDGRRPARQGAAAEPRRLDRPRVELHLPGRPLEGDDAAHARERAPVRGAGRLHRVRRHRGRAHRGADGGAAPPDGVGEVLGHRAGLARDAGRDQGARPVHRRVDPRSAASTRPARRRRRLAARGHDHARAGAASRAASRCFANTEVLGMDVEGGRIRRVRTTRGRRSRPRSS